MRIALIADAYPPMRSSAAVQLRDLSQELVRQGHLLTVMIPSSDLKQPWLLEDMNGVQVMRLKAPRTKDIGYVQRTINEFLLPFMMLRNLRKSPFADVRWDGVVWYSPPIFLGPANYGGFENLVKNLLKYHYDQSIRDVLTVYCSALTYSAKETGLPFCASALYPA